jgi:hypothetical protein
VVLPWPNGSAAQAGVDPSVAVIGADGSMDPGEMPRLVARSSGLLTRLGSQAKILAQMTVIAGGIAV